MRIGVNIERRTRCGMESTFAVPQKDREKCGLVIRNYQVRVAVAVHIGYGHVVGKMPGGERRALRRMKCARAITKQHSDRAVVGIGDEDIGIAIMVDVGDGDPTGTASSSEGNLVVSDGQPWSTHRGRGGQQKNCGNDGQLHPFRILDSDAARLNSISPAISWKKNIVS